MFNNVIASLITNSGTGIAKEVAIISQVAGVDL